VVFSDPDGAFPGLWGAVLAHIEMGWKSIAPADIDPLIEPTGFLQVLGCRKMVCTGDERGDRDARGHSERLLREFIVPVLG